MPLGIEFSRKLALAYNAVCKPLCRELGLSKTAFDILMFLGNNPTYKTARDVVELRCLKANLVSSSGGRRRATAARRSCCVRTRRSLS